jgi:TRAF3-interacting protein 1
VLSIALSSIYVGFGTGLFAEDQLQSENVKEKEQKVNFLTRLQHAVQLGIGREIDVNPGKIIVGVEPEKTNALLQGLAECCANAANINMTQIVAGVDSGAKPGSLHAKPAASAAAAAAPARSTAVPASSGAGGGGPLRPSRAPIELPPGVGGEDFVATTMRVIGALIDKPKMVDKLLRKPPFRFIHDIVTAVMAKTTYPEGYFTPDELNSANFTETNAKLAFLQKLIDLVAATNSVDLSQVNPKKIAAGLEPENTNTLLQQFGYAAASGISARDVMARLASGYAPSGGATAAAPADDGAAAAAASAAAAAQAEAARKAKAAADAESRKAAALAASAEKERAAQAAAATAAANKPMPKLGLSDLSRTDQSENAVAQGGEEDQVRTKIERPKTARKAPPKLPSNLIEEKKAVVESASAASAQHTDEKKQSEPISRVIAEGANIADADDDDEDDHANGGMGGADVLAGFDSTEGGGEDGLVVRSMKNKLKEAGGGDGGMKIRSSAAAGAGMTASQLEELRRSVQTLCQSVNPLGKCVEFVREDVDAMSKELARWKTVHIEYTEQLEQEKKTTERIVEPITIQINEADYQMAEMQRYALSLIHTYTLSHNELFHMCHCRIRICSFQCSFIFFFVLHLYVNC